MLTAVRWRRGARVEALGDRVEDAPVANLPLRVWQERVFARAGMRLEETEEPESIEERRYLLFQDNLFLSLPLLKQFVRAAKREASSGANACFQLALPASPFTRLACFTGEQREIELPGGRRCLLFGLFWIEGKATAASLENASPVVLEPWRKDIRIPFSTRIPTMSDAVVPFTDAAVLEITSWVHLWLANMFAIGVSLLDPLRTPAHWPWLAAKALSGILLAGSLSPYRLAASMAGRLVVRGRGCRIHPSAVVEASILGDGVEIGPGSVVRGSLLGDGVKVLELSSVDVSVLGRNALVSSRGMVKLTLAYPRAVFNWCQTGVVGERAYMASMFRPLDLKFRGEVRVRHQGRLVSTGLPFFGCCIGHRAIVSGDSRLAPGRVIPNDYRILTDMGAIEEVPDLPTEDFLRDRGGKLEPFRRKDGQGT